MDFKNEPKSSLPLPISPGSSESSQKAYPNNYFLCWMVQDSDVRLPQKKNLKNMKSAFCQMDSHQINLQGTKMSHWCISKVILVIQEIHKTAPLAPSWACPQARDTRAMSESSPPEKLWVANFQDLGLYGKKDIASLKRLMSFKRQMPWMLGRGQQRSRGDGGRDMCRESLHSSMSGMVRRCPPHGNNCSRRTSSPGGHWSLADGWAVTCPSHPALGSLSEECTCQHRDP